MKEKILRNRSVLLSMALIGVLMVYLLRLMQLQIVDGAELEKKLNDSYPSYQIIKATRGEIFDRNGRPLVTNTIGLDVVIDRAYVVPKEINQMLLRLIQVMEQADEDWVDRLPLTDHAPFQFRQTSEQAEAALKNILAIFQILAGFNTASYHFRPSKLKRCRKLKNGVLNCLVLTLWKRHSANMSAAP